MRVGSCSTEGGEVAKLVGWSWRSSDDACGCLSVVTTEIAIVVVEEDCIIVIGLDGW